MNERPDTHLTPELLSAARLRHFYCEQVRRLRVLQGDRNPSPTGVVLDAERAVKLWKWIPNDELQRTIDRARYLYGTSKVTLELVAKAWVERRKKQAPSAEERERRRAAAEARAERERGTPEQDEQFYREIQEKLQ